MNLYISATDNDWFRFLSHRPDIDEVSLWQPSRLRQFRGLQPGDPFLFKLDHPENFIVAGGMFAHFSTCPVDLAWKAFGEETRVATLEAMGRRLAH